MKLHHLRNATLIIEHQEHMILVDPMLGKVGTQPPFTLFRFKARKNPLIPLPDNSQEKLDRVTHCLITHKHPDHIDKAAIHFLMNRNIPVICSEKDGSFFQKRGLKVVQEIAYWEEVPFLNGTIMGIPARHGYGFIATPMGNVMGFLIKWTNAPSLYISADTIFTEAVEKVLMEYQPDVAVLACGTAQLDIGQPLLMTLDDILRFVEKAPGKVLANHMEALNHCPTTRAKLTEGLIHRGLIDKVYIPKDGEIVEV